MNKAKKNLYLRIDIDSYIGLKKGVPNLLKLFEKYNVRATFFLTMKREGNLFEYVKYRHFRKEKNPELEDFPNSTLKRLKDRKFEIFKMLFFPSSFYNERKIINDIIKKNHELQIHCHTHVKWANPHYKEVKKDILKAINSYRKLTNLEPSGFATPYNSWNKDIAKVIKESDFKYISINNQNPYPHIFVESNKLNIPITLSFTEKSLPICEYYARKGYYGKELTNKAIEYINNQAQKSNFLSTYIHPRIEGIELLDEFSSVIEEISKNYNLTRTFIDIKS